MTDDDQLLAMTLPPTLRDRLQARADEHGTTVIELLEQALDHQEHCRQHKLIPADARARPRHWVCRLLRHRGLRYREASAPTPDGVTATWIAEASCIACRRPQPSVRVRFPRNYTLAVDGPPPEVAAADAEGHDDEAAG